MKISNAYTQQLTQFESRFNAIQQKVHAQFTKPQKGFADFLQESLQDVNELHQQKDRAIEAFASGENQDVQSLMIAMQRASTATQLTTAVRNKILEMYRELSQLPL